MVGKFFKKSFNKDVFEKQKITILFFIFLSLLFFFFPRKEKPIFKKEDLLIDINKASYQELLSVPYIGKKTAKQIIQIRKKKGKITLEDLGKLRNYKRFRYFLKD